MRQRLILVSALLLSLAACGGDDGPPAPLAYVPADTPYVIGAIDPMPKEIADQWMAMSDELIPFYKSLLEQGLREHEAKAQALGDDEDDDDAAAKLNAGAVALMRALNTELEGKTSASELLDAWGLMANPRAVFFGIELVPVMRMELADPAKFSASIERVVASAGGSLPKLKIDDIDYWSFRPDETPLQLVFAVHGGQLVASLAPVGAPDDLLKRLLGLELPKHSLLDEGALARLNKRMGFVPYGSGYLDHARVFELIANPRTGSQSGFLKALKFNPEPLSEACLAEGRALMQQWPLSSLGYTRFDARGYRMLMRMEAPTQVMQDLRTVLAPTPGLAEADSALLSISLALKVDALPPLATKWASAVQAKPWTCESLQPLNEGFAMMRDTLQNPAVYAVGPSANAVHVLLSRFELPAVEGELPDFAGKLLIGSPNPQGLIAMARNFVPQLAEFRLEPDAEPVALPSLPEVPADMKFYGASNATTLGIAMGEGEQASLRQAMQTPAGGPQPLLHSSYQGRFYAQFMRLVIAQEEGKNPNAPDMDAMVRFYEKAIERVGGQLLFSPEGIEISSEYQAPAR